MVSDSAIRRSSDSHQSIKKHKGVLIGFIVSCFFGISFFYSNRIGDEFFDGFYEGHIWYALLFFCSLPSALIMIQEDFFYNLSDHIGNIFYFAVTILYFPILGGFVHWCCKNRNKILLIIVTAVVLILHLTAYVYIRSTFDAFEEGMKSALP